MDDDVLASL